MSEKSEGVSRVPDDAEETPPDFDPLLHQAEHLPEFLRGSEGGLTQARPAGPEDEEPDDAEDEFGFTPIDPSTFTAD